MQEQAEEFLSALFLTTFNRQIFLRSKGRVCRTSFLGSSTYGLKNFEKKIPHLVNREFEFSLCILKGIYTLYIGKNFLCEDASKALYSESDLFFDN